MNVKGLVVAASMVCFVCPTLVQAVPVEDCAKPKEVIRLETEVQSKFSSFYGGNHVGLRQSYGRGYESAKRILRRALRNSQNESVGSDIREIKRAVKKARNKCEGTADRFVKILDVYVNAYGAVRKSVDKLEVMRGGLRYLTSATPKRMTREILGLGLSMTSSALTSFRPATKVLDVILVEARQAARRTSRDEWSSLMTFAIRASDSLRHFQSKFALQSRVAGAVIESRPGQAVFLKALSLVSEMTFNNSRDHVRIMEMGLMEYASSVPYENHRQVAMFLPEAAREVNSNSSRIAMYRSIMPNFVGLDADITPADKVVLRAGIQLAKSDLLSTIDRYQVARVASRRVLAMPISGFSKEILSDGLNRAKNAFLPVMKVRILRESMRRAMR